MPEDMFQYLGAFIRKSRKDCELTQEELAEQSGVSSRHIANIEKGLINPSYEVLATLKRRLGFSGESLFHPDYLEQDEEIKQFIGKYLACSEHDRKILIRTLNCLANELLRKSDTSKDDAEDTK
ncbi:helix-turn-helix transcriptional regulator [Zongyangia sp. HA2173]|uniref:helix-turn-helix transcriptional regulator n=1 Tax=Zongyangia sp. HA2173 TaxID=3133035 RepID=UPI0031636A7C